MDGIMTSFGSQTTSSVALTYVQNDLWVFNNVDASLLIAGLYYSVCADIDGPVKTYGFGDTGFQVYISGVTAVTPITIRSTYDQLRLFPVLFAILEMVCQRPTLLKLVIALPIMGTCQGSTSQLRLASTHHRLNCLAHQEIALPLLRKR